VNKIKTNKKVNNINMKLVIAFCIIFLILVIPVTVLAEDAAGTAASTEEGTQTNDSSEVESSSSQTGSTDSTESSGTNDSTASNNSEPTPVNDPESSNDSTPPPADEAPASEGSDNNPESQPSDDNPAESQTTDQPEITPQSDNLDDSEQAEPTDSNDDTDSGPDGDDDGTDNSGDIDPDDDGPELPSLETGETPVDDPDHTVVGETNSTTTSYFQVQEESMNSLFSPGTMVEIVSEDYAEGDIVVAQKSDGTYIIKMLSGNQLVSLGAGVSYEADDMTILGAAELSSMTTKNLEQSGQTWHTALARTGVVPSGGGTSGSPYQIASWQNLYWLSQQSDTEEWEKIFEQTVDIAFPTTGEDDIKEWAGKTGWTPIGTDSSDPFTGTYDGGGFTISNLFIDRSDTDYQGLFGYTGSGAVLKNIGLEDVDITGKGSVGGLVGYNNNNNDGMIANSYATGVIVGHFDNVGGLVGWNTGTVKSSYATGNVTGYRLNVGGLVGKNDGGTIENSYATGKVTGTNNNVGGLVGFNTNGGTIENSYATGDVTSTGDRIGGLVGNNGHQDYICTIEYSYATGSVTGNTVGTVGGLVGFNGVNKEHAITNSYWNTEAAARGVGNIEDHTGVTRKTIAEIQTIAFHQNLENLGWNITGQDGSYPLLGWQVYWTEAPNTWYMGTPPAPDNTNGGSFGGDFGFFDFEFAPGLALLAQNGTGLTTLTGQGNAPITPGLIASGNWNDLNQAVAAYQAALVDLENSITTLSPAELALQEVELVIARAAILALEAKLLAAEGKPFNLANLQAAYAAAVAAFNANQSFLSTDQKAAANQLLTAIAGVIAALE
jgi:hypothetical protein